MTAIELHQPNHAVARFFGAPQPVRVAFGHLERTAPELGGRWAERIWFTLPRVRRRSSLHHGWLGASDAARATQPWCPLGGTHFSLDVAGHEVVGTTWGEGPAVYLVHGWAGHSGDLAAFVPALAARRYLAARGYRVIAFDAPSHGGSAPGAFGPRSSSLPEFVDTLAAVVAAHGRPHAIIAHSMGAAAAVTALCDGMPAGRLALLAPMASPAAYARHFALALGAGDRIYRDLVARVERRIRAPLHQFDGPALGRAVAMPPTLIVHDRQDSLMPVDNGTAIAHAWPGARLHLTSGLGHRRLLRDPDVVAEVVDFVCT